VTRLVFILCFVVIISSWAREKTTAAPAFAASGAAKPEANRSEALRDVWRKQLKTGDKATRFEAACSLAACRDVSGLPELKRALERFQTEAAKASFADYYNLKRLVIAFEQLTGKSFGELPPDPFILSDLAAAEKVKRRWQEVLDAWAKWWAWEPGAVSEETRVLRPGRVSGGPIELRSPIMPMQSAAGRKAAPDLAGDLVLYYGFDREEDERVTDLSGGGNDGYVHGANFVQEQGDWSLVFDGKGDYVGVDNIDLREFSFAAWVRPTLVADNRRIFLLDNGQDYYAIQLNSRGGVDFCVHTGSGVTETVNEYGWHFVENQWTHIAVSFDGQRVNIYQNGRRTETSRVSSVEGVRGTGYIGGGDSHGGTFGVGVLMR